MVRWAPGGLGDDTVEAQCRQIQLVNKRFNNPDRNLPCLPDKTLNFSKRPFGAQQSQRLIRRFLKTPNRGFWPLADSARAYSARFATDPHACILVFPAPARKSVANGGCG